MEPVIPRVITADDLEAECLRRKYASLLEKPEVFPSEANWEFIIAHRMEGIGTLLLRKYLVSWMMPEEKRSIYHRQALRLFPEYLSAVRRPYAVEVVYSDVESAPDAFLELVRSARLFDSRRLKALIEQQGAVELVIDLLDVFQPEYTDSDARAMRALLGALRSLPKLGRVEEHRGIFSTEMRYYCPAGHSNPCGEAFCRHEDCRLNIFGLTPEQVQAIENFEARTEALESLLRKPLDP